MTSATDRALDAATLVGLLADDHRRQAFAAVELGASSLDDVVAATGLTQPAAAKALGRLVEAGLVISVSDEGKQLLHAMGAAFQAAARVAMQRTPSDEHRDLPDEARRVMRAFVVDGRLQSIPTAYGKRLVILDWLAQDFELGRKYTEPMVNLVIGKRHPDTAALRRYLVDAGMLDRADGEYWRSGGSTVR